MIQLKSICLPERFATLIEPDLAVGQVRSNRELYAAVKAAPKVVILPFKEWTFDYDAPQELAPHEFIETWQGD